MEFFNHSDSNDMPSLNIPFDMTNQDFLPELLFEDEFFEEEFEEETDEEETDEEEEDEYDNEYIDDYYDMYSPLSYPGGVDI